jgi:heme/copper-type cytochrome/quinol oxidase subunit 1
MRFETPQFIEVEDKIFGPLSWRQFLYVGGGVGMAVVLFFMTPFIVFVIFGVPLALLAGALAFYPVNNRPFSYLLEGIVNYFTNQRLYLWRRDETTVYKPQENLRSESRSPAVGSSNEKKDISSLARRLELEAIQKQP